MGEEREKTREIVEKERVRRKETGLRGKMREKGVILPWARV